MNEKTMKKTITASIAALLIIALAIALACFFNKPMPTTNAAGEVFRATYVSSHGLLTDDGLTADEQGRKHRTKAQEASYMNVAESSILEITNGQALYEFLNGGYGSYTHAYLAADVSFAYSNASGASKDYQYTVSKGSSNAVFTRVLDGNGYTLSLWGGTAVLQYTSDNSDVNSRQYADNYYSKTGVSAQYTGFLMAINQGTVRNLTIDYESAHGAIAATEGPLRDNKITGSADPNWSGNDNTDGTGLFVKNGGSDGAIGGVIAGFNDEGGLIENVRLNLKGNFKMIDRNGNDKHVYSNYSFVGGFVGRAGGSSAISNCQIDIAESAGIYAGTAGKHLGGTNDLFCLSAAGGLVGRIDQGTRSSQLVDANNQPRNLTPALVQYCVVSGGGKVKAYVACASGKGNGKSDQRGGYMVYSGGAIGGCFDMVSDGSNWVMDETDNKNNHVVNNGQVVGIISDWTGIAQSNYRNIDTQSYGQLFGSVGENVEQSVVLYNLTSLRESLNNTQISAENVQYNNIYLDFYRGALTQEWAAIYPTNEGGEVKVRLNGENIIATAIADGSDVTEEDLVAVAGSSASYEFEQGQTGNIIWRATNGGGSDRINLQDSAPVYAEKAAISSRDTGNYEYTFGKITTINFENTNGDTNTRKYQGKNAILNKPTVVSALGGTLEAYKDEEWIISRNGIETDITGTALPGAYRMNVQAEDQTFYPMGYYSEDQKIAAWRQENDYVYTITVGELNYGANTQVENGWSNSATFELMMTSADDFDKIKSYSNGKVQDCAFTKLGAGATVKITESTGKNGMKYSFVAYAQDPATGKDIEVARTKTADDKLVKIDNELPEIGEMTYYVKSGNTETPISASELSAWRKERVVVRYNVIDTKSGLRNVPSSLPDKGITISNGSVKSDGSYDVEVTLSKNAEYVISYQDNVGNTLKVKLQANVDYMTTAPTMEFFNEIYRKNAYGYSTQGAIISFNTTIGCSDWQLQYSWQKDANGDIWEDAMAQNAAGANTEDKFIMNSSNTYSFRINWNMGDAKNGEAPFKMRMVNVYGLYDTVELTEDDNTFVGKYYINYKVANIYVNKTLDGVKVKGGEYNNRSLADLMKNLSASELAAFLDKSYDGTDEYRRNVEFVVPVEFGTDQRESEETIQQFVDESGVGVLYSLAYLARPQNIDVEIKINLKYSSANAGKVSLIASFAEEQDADVLDKYNLFFADFVDASGDKNIDFTDEYTVVADKFISSTRAIENRNINKLTYEIELSNSDVVKGLPLTYYYGQKVPAMVQAHVPGLQDPVDVQLNSPAQSVAAIDTYNCSGEAVNYDKANMDLTVRMTQVTVQPLPVYIEVKFDGKVDIPSTISASTSHTFTATYDDIYGKAQNADVQLMLLNSDNEVVETYDNASIYKRGTYRIVVSIKDANYAVSDANFIDGTLMLNFKIVQGRLNLAMGVNVVEYDGGKGIEYDAGIPSNISSQLLNEKEEISYAYYPYLEGAKYDATTNTISGNTWDRENQMEQKPSEVGLYHVVVSFKGNESFIANEYSGDMQIVKATTVINVEKEVSYPYEVDDDTQLAIARTYDLVVAEMRINAVGIEGEKDLLWKAANDADYSLINIKYRDTENNTWVDIQEGAVNKGWFTQMGSYLFLIEYLGDDCYAPCSKQVYMYITPALFKNIAFEGVEGTYDGSDFTDDLSPVGLGAYPLAKVEYSYDRDPEWYDSLREFEIRSAGEHTVTMRISQEGFQTMTIPVKVNIKKAKIEGITAIPVVATYDGEKHEVKFNGFQVVNGNYRYNGLSVTVSAYNNVDDEGNLYAVNAGIYTGKVTVRVANHEDLTIDTFIQIDAIKVAVEKAGTTLPNKIPSGTELKKDLYFGWYTQDGENIPANLKYRNENGDIVTPNSSGVLPDGKYTVELNVGDNYYIDYKWELVVGNINAKELTVGGIVAVVAVVVVMVAAIVTSVVVVNNRKKKEVVA